MSKKRKPRPPRNRPLSVKVVNGVLTIEIGVETLAFSCLCSPYLFDQMGPKQERPDTRFAISDAGGFAADVKHELLRELGEDGSSILTNLIDKACEQAIEQGSEHLIDKEYDAEGYAQALSAKEGKVTSE